MSGLENLPQNTLASSATFLVILRRYFEFCVSGMSSHWRYSEDPESTGILIELGYNTVIEEVGKKPAIAVTRGNFGTRRTSIGDRAKVEWPGHSESSVYNKEIYGTMNINVYSSTGGEAESIANLVFELFITTEQILEKEFKFKWLGDINVGPVQITEESKSVFVVPLSLSPLVYDMSWVVKPTTPILKRMGIYGKDVIDQLKETVYNEFFPNNNKDT